MNKIIILPYFGKLPNYFSIFMRSCEYNSDFDFIIFTDQDISVEIDSNIRVVRMTFDDLNNLVQRSIGNNYKLKSPYKLCDYKPAYGKIFEEYVYNYDFWGHCDADMIFGHISDFISDADFENYDKLLIKGHLTFYKNTEEVNNYFLLGGNGCMSFNVAAQYKEPCFFDEIVMPKILSNYGIEQYTNYSYADILPQYLNFKLAGGEHINNYSNQKFYYENGRICREYTDNGTDKTDSFMYIHLQKRKMTLDAHGIDLSKKVYINQNIFTNDYNKISDLHNTRYRFKYYWQWFKKISIARIRIKLKIFKDKRLSW